MRAIMLSSAGPLGRRDRRRAVVPGQGLDQLRILGELTEPRSVMGQSVMALVGGRDHHGDHLPVDAGEGGGAVHQGAVEEEVAAQGLRAQAVDLEDVVHLPIRSHQLPVELGQAS